MAKSVAVPCVILGVSRFDGSHRIPCRVGETSDIEKGVGVRLELNDDGQYELVFFTEHYRVDYTVLPGNQFCIYCNLAHRISPIYIDMYKTTGVSYDLDLHLEKETISAAWSWVKEIRIPLTMI